MCSDLELLHSRRPEDVGRFHDRHVDSLNEWFEPRVHDPDDVADLTAETFATALMQHRRAAEPVDEWLHGLAERRLAAYRRRGDAERRMRRRLGMREGDLRTELVAASERGVPTYQLPSARAVLSTAAVLAIVVILVVAFTGGRRDEPRSPAAEATAARTADRQLFGGSLEPGVRYRAGALVPSISFVVGDTDWFAAETGGATGLLLGRRSRVPGQPGSERPPTQFLSFSRLTEVYGPERRGLTGSLVPAPADLERWFATHPDLRLTGVTTVTVADLAGKSLDVAVRFERAAHPDPACDAFRRAGCTAIAPGLSFFNGTRMRAILLPTAPDPLLIALIAAPRGDLAELEAAVAPVLDSLRIGAE